jgi:tetraacyldisaccharide 4'-kinase
MRSLFERIQKDNRASFFYSAAKSVFHLFSAIWLLGYRLRVFAYRSGVIKPRKLKAKVISVGNITLGGTGKTPLVIYIAHRLKERGFKVAVLSRGYKRRKRGLIELTGEDRNRVDWTEVGDEPYLLSSRLNDIPVVVCKDRGVSGVRAERKYQADVLVLDDGFQHWKLPRNLDVVVIDSTNPFGNSKLFPAGVLREPLSGLRRADVFILNKANQLSHKQDIVGVLRSYNREAPIIESTYKINSVRRLFGDRPKNGGLPMGVEEKELKGKKVLAFSGIGNPVSFEKSLEVLGVEVIKHRKFPDHFSYKKPDIMNMEREAQKSGADFMITTEKDSVRIPMMEDLHIPIYVLKIDLVIIEGEELLWKEIEGRLNYGNKN